MHEQAKAVIFSHQTIDNFVDIVAAAELKLSLFSFDEELKNIIWKYATPCNWNLLNTGVDFNYQMVQSAKHKHLAHGKKGATLYQQNLC